MNKVKQDSHPLTLRASLITIKDRTHGLEHKLLVTAMVTIAVGTVGSQGIPLNPVAMANPFNAISAGTMGTNSNTIIKTISINMVATKSQPLNKQIHKSRSTKQTVTMTKMLMFNPMM